MENRKEGRFLDDAQSLRALIDTMPRVSQVDYESYGSRSMEVGFPNRYMAVYTLRNGQPEDIELWRFGDLTMDRIRGPQLELEIPNKGLVSIGLVPAQVGGREVYLHVPQSFELKWKGKPTPKGIQFVPQFAVLVKTRSREHSQTEGHTYCVTLNKFRERFPDAKIRY